MYKLIRSVHAYKMIFAGLGWWFIQLELKWLVSEKKCWH